MEGHILVTRLLLGLLFVTLIVAIIFNRYILSLMPGIAYAFMLFWLVAAIIFTGLSEKYFVPFFLLSLFCLLISWRIAGIYSLYSLGLLYLVGFLGFCFNFIYCAYHNIHSTTGYSLFDWQLIFIKLYIGFNFIPHFTEKLFAGSGPHLADVTAFMQLNVPSADFFVWLAGCCEMGAAIAIGLGFLMRIGAVGAVLYLLIATYLGHHFSLGFIWAGGGWEFATMWMVFISTFAITGFNLFSIDQVLRKRWRFPRWLT